MSEATNDGTRPREGGAVPRPALPGAIRIIAALILVSLSGLMLAYWRKYTVGRAAPDLNVLSQGTYGVPSPNENTQNANVIRHRNGHHPLSQRTKANTSSEENANTNATNANTNATNANTVHNKHHYRHSRRRHRSGEGNDNTNAVFNTNENATNVNVVGEQTDLSGTYIGTINSPGMTGDATLTISGNQFTLSGVSSVSGRIVTVTTRGYIGATLRFDSAGSSIPQTVSVRVRKTGNRLTLSPVPGETNKFSFTPAGAGGGARRSNANSVTTRTVTGQESTRRRRRPTAPAPTPSPTSTPAQTPTPSDEKPKQDKITVERPERFLEGKEDTLTCELAIVSGEVMPTETVLDGVATSTAKPDMPEGGQAVPLAHSFGENYTSFAQFSLVSDDLDFTPDSLAVQPAPAEVGQKADWVWKVRLKDGARAAVSFTVRLDVVWKPKTEGGKEKEKVRRVWEKKFENVPVGLPSLVKVSKYGFPVPLTGGLVALVVPGLRRRRLEELENVEAEVESRYRAAGRGTLVGGAVPAGAEGDEVTCSLFTPKQASPGDGFLVQVFAHLTSQADQLAALAWQADDEAKLQGAKKLDAPVERGTELAVTLSISDLKIDEPSQTFNWDGEINVVQFGVTVPENHKPGTLFGIVTVSRNSVPIGHIKFTFRIVSAAQQPQPAPPEIAPVREFTRYKRAFISYSSKDRAEVLRRVQMLDSAGVNYFQDLLDLEPGQRWEPLLYRYIDECDVFFLFWSTAAKKSRWVKKEVQRALKRKGSKYDAPPEIVPVPIEGPPPVKPPRYLAAIHFNDKFLYFILGSDKGA